MGISISLSAHVSRSAQVAAITPLAEHLYRQMGFIASKLQAAIYIFRIGMF